MKNAPASEKKNTDILSADAIKSLLPEDFSGDLIVLETTESTNLDAAKIVKTVPHGTTILADAQTAGRGRLGRSFFAPSGGIYMSVILHLNLAFSDAVLITT
ncbi:biotin--[acetyl-CoA-carboxylase] ligase, partial [Methanocorpusculaceae archaeon]|nr:biotin--[acetyl-CoA-carboxylase] ligase [Methanocorpusculaceae archaeon]